MADIYDVAHTWAQDVQGTQYNANKSMFRADSAIYSYGGHWMLASHYTTKKRRGVPSRRVTLVNRARSSNTTAKHLSAVLYAVPSWNADVMYVVNKLTEQDTRELTPERALELAYGLVADIAETLDKAERARTNKDFHLSEASSALRNLNHFCEAFNVKLSREGLESVEQIAAIAVKREKALEAARKKEARAEEKRKAAKLSEWQAGASDMSPVARDVDGFCYIRRNGDMLETSQRARVPWDEAVKAFRLIRACQARGKAWTGEMAVGAFTVSGISKSGDMRANCHHFKWDRMKALAEAEGVWETTAPDLETA